MRMRARLIGTVAMVVGLWMLGAAGTSTAGDKKKLAASLDKIANLLEKNDVAGAKKEAEAFAKSKDFDLSDAMVVFKLRAKGGVGVGSKPGEINPDGIEAFSMNLEKAQQKTVDSYPAEMARMALVTAAVAEMIVNQCPVKKKMKDKDPKEWKQWSEDMHAAALELAAAAKNKKLNDIKAAAKKLNNSCVSCHSPFRE